MSNEPLEASIWTNFGWRAPIIVLLCAAFSPVIADLALHMRDAPYARAALAAPILSVAACRGITGGVTELRSREGIWICLMIGLTFEIVAVGADALRIGRVGLALALAGWLWGTGSGRFTAAILMFWMIPVPWAVVRIPSPWLEKIFGTLVAVIVPGGELQGAADAPILAVGEQTLRLSPLDGGLALCVGLAGVGWYRSAHAPGGALAAAAAALRFGALGLPIQGLILLSGALMLALGADAAVARAVLDHAGWALIVTASALSILATFGGSAFDALRWERA